MVGGATAALKNLFLAIFFAPPVIRMFLHTPDLLEQLLGLHITCDGHLLVEIVARHSIHSCNNL